MAGLQGKVVLVTGGTDGIGLAAAHAVGKAGAKVVVASRKQANVDKAIASLKGAGVEAAGMAAHAAKKEEIKKMVAFCVDKYGGLDHLFINHAVSPGLMSMTPFTKQMPVCTEAQWDKIFETNVKSFWLLTIEAFPHLKKGSSIVMNASMGGYFPGPPTPVYGVSKTALLGMTKSLAVELGVRGIRVNAVAPGVIKTKLAGYQLDGEIGKQRAAGTMLRRLGEPREIGDVVRFLMSEDASYITGENFAIAGGAMTGGRL